MVTEWERRLAEWQAELELIAQLEDIRWVPLGRAEAEVGVSRSTLRSRGPPGRPASNDVPNGR